MVISICVLSLLVYWAVKEDQFALVAAAEKKWGWLGAAFAGCLLGHLLGYARWRTLVRALELPFTRFDAVRIGLIGTFFSVFAFGTLGGDSLRAYHVSRQMKDRTAEAISSVVIDRLFGLLTMFMIASTAWLIIGVPDSGLKNPEMMSAIKLIANASMALAVIGLTGLAVLIFAPSFTRTSLFKWLTGLPEIGELIERLTGVVETYRDKPGTIGVCFLYSVAVNLCFAFSIYAIATGISGARPTLGEHMLIEPISMVANALPLGGMELTLNYLYNAFLRVSSADEFGIVVAFVFRLTILNVAALGAIAWFYNRRSLSNVVEEAAHDV